MPWYIFSEMKCLPPFDITMGGTQILFPSFQYILLQIEVDGVMGT